MEQITQAELDELLNLQTNRRKAFLKWAQATTRKETKAAKNEGRAISRKIQECAILLEQKTNIPDYLFTELAYQISMSNLPHEVFYKILKLLGKKITEPPTK